MTIAATGGRLSGVRPESIAGNGLLLLLLAVGALQLLDRRQSALLKRPEQELASVVKALSAIFAFAYVGTFLFSKGALFRHGAIVWFVCALPSVLMGRFIVRAAYVKLWKAGYARKRVVMIGAGEGLREFQRHLAIQRFGGYQVLGSIQTRDSDADRVPRHDWPVLGQLDDWRAILECTRANVVVIDLDEATNPNSLMTEIIQACRQLGIEVESVESTIPRAWRCL